MKDAVGVFQDAAAKGKFVVSGVETELEEKLTGFKRGVLDVWTQVHMKKVVEKGGKVSTSSQQIFPLHSRPAASYKEAPRSFGCNREKDRKHGGCDLYAPEGTEVLAVKDGIVIQGPYAFYLGTVALEINHGDFTVRYTEMKDKNVAGVHAGAKIKAGQVIGYVGKMDGINETMLHFEMYSGTITGQLTDRQNPPYQRRSDLINPTDYLDKMTPKRGI